MHSLSVNGINLHYTKRGSGDPLILLHGNGEDLTIFDPLAEKLAEHFTVYAIDSRNHGKSEKTDQYHYETMRDDILEFIEVLNIKTPHLLGFSDGSIVTMLMAIKAQNRLNRLILLGPNLTPDDLTDACLRYVRILYTKTQDPLYKMMMDEPNITPDELKNVQNRTLVIGAENDLYKPMTFERIVGALPHSELTIIKGHDHGSYIVNNDLIYEDVFTFLTQD